MDAASNVGPGRYLVVSQLIWFNGEVIPMAEARLSVEDRGYQFADGVYEVIRYYNGKPFTICQHMERLLRSADGIKLSLPMQIDQLGGEISKFITRTGIREGSVYLQLTRGVCDRNHKF